jgi:hypothetical protein
MLTSIPTGEGDIHAINTIANDDYDRSGLTSVCSP